VFLRTTILLFGAAVLSATCDRPAPPTSVPIPPIQASGGSNPECAYPPGNSYTYYHPGLACGALVRIQVNNGSGLGLLDSVTQARAPWSTLFTGYNLPTLGTPSTATQAAPKITVVFDLGQTGTKWCGSTNVSTLTITAQRTTTGHCTLTDPSGAMRVVNGLINLLKHEFSHALGFPRHLNDNNQHPPTESCLANVPGDPQNPAIEFNANLCAHDRAVVYWGYVLRQTVPDLDSPQVSSSVMLNPTTATIVPGANQQFGAMALRDDEQPVTVDWVIVIPSVATFNGTPTETGATVHGENLGQTGITATIRETSQLVWPTGHATATLTVADLPPTGLSASNVAATTATINWTNGNPGSGTTIQQRVNGTSTWITAGTATAGATSLGINNLTACTWYDVNAYHLSVPTTASNLFVTASGSVACAPSRFTLVSCTDVGNNRSYNVAWTQSEFSTGSTYEIGKTNTSDPSGATIIKSGPSYKTNATLGPYSKAPPPQYLYFWVRHKLSGGTGASAWVALDNQPVVPSGGCF
jgi:hypothetical protein